MGKSRLLWKVGRAREAIAFCDNHLDRSGTSRDNAFSLLDGFILFDKGMALLQVGDLETALGTCDQVLASLREIESTELREFLVAKVMCLKGVIHVLSDRTVEALRTFDEVVIRFGTALSTPLTAAAVASSLVAKALLLEREGRTIKESEFSLLLVFLAEHEDLPPHSVNVISSFIINTRPARALELIQESPAAEMLLPLVTALQQELGQNPQVAKEVCAVAQDIRFKFEIGQPTVSVSRATDNSSND